MMTRERQFEFGGRPFILKIVQSSEQDFAVELWEVEPELTCCYAADFLDELEADIEWERVLDDVAAYV
jgi:hypothetical protein